MSNSRCSTPVAQTALNYCLQQSANNNVVKSFASKISSTPFKIAPQLQHEIKKLQPILLKAIDRIVTDYHYNVEIADRLRLSADERSLLRATKDQVYEIGCIRPDVLFDIEGKIHICEINARFPTNGFILSSYLRQYFHSQAADAQSLILQLARRFDLRRPIRIIKGRERGFDINLLEHELTKYQAAVNCKICAPSDLQLSDGTLYCNGIACDQLVLELHQDELLALNEDVLSHIIQHCDYFNDIRTILIVHNKRFLALLNDVAFLEKYLDHDQATYLSSHVIESHALDKKTVDAILLNTNDWVLKKTSSGKGEGMLIGMSTPTDVMASTLHESACQYMAQRYLPQKKFTLTDGLNNHQQTAKFIVGMLMSYNNLPLGLGFLRAGAGDNVNASSAGGEIIGWVEREP